MKSNEFRIYIQSSPTYQLVNKSKSKSKDKDKDKGLLKEAPLVDPEPTSDISNFNAPAQSTNNGNISSDTTKPASKALQSTMSAYGKPQAIHLLSDGRIKMFISLFFLIRRFNIRQPISD